jgi:hypothetical protein
MYQWPARSTSASPAAGWCHSSFAPCRPVQLPVVVHHRASALYGPCGAALPAVAVASRLALTGASASRVALPSAVARPLKRPLERKRHIDSTTEEESDDSDESDGDSATARVSSSASIGGPSAAALPPARCSPFTALALQVRFPSALSSTKPHPRTAPRPRRRSPRRPTRPSVRSQALSTSTSVERRVDGHAGGCQLHPKARQQDATLRVPAAATKRHWVEAAPLSTCRPGCARRCDPVHFEFAQSVWPPRPAE